MLDIESCELDSLVLEGVGVDELKKVESNELMVVTNRQC